MATFNSRTGSPYGGGMAVSGGTGTYGSAATPTFTASAYGKIPTPTAIPKSIYEEAQAADPGLTGMNTQANSVISGQLAGTLSPETIKSLQDNAAQFGVASGMPGSGLAGNGGLRNLGLNVEALQNQGLGNYQGALKNLASMQLDPGLVSSIGTYNNQLAAAPDPAAAAAQTEALYQAHYGQAQDTAAQNAAREQALWLERYKLTSSPAWGSTGTGYGSGPVGPRINPGPAASTTTGTANTDPFGLARSETIFGSLADAGGVTANQTPLWGPQGYNFDPNYYNMLANPAGAGESLYPWAGQNVLKGQDAPFNYDTASMA